MEGNSLSTTSSIICTMDNDYTVHVPVRVRMYLHGLDKSQSLV